jgi:prepilin-type N-terminal cleavage/methylation domain-containing protein
MRKTGFSMTELLVVMAIGGLLLAFMAPPFMEFMERSRHNAAARLVLNEVRTARARAIATGWEYRMVGYEAGSTSSRRNQYRIFARRSPTVAWPGEEDPSMSSTTQLARDWVSLPDRFVGLGFDAPAPRFELTFDSRGAASGAPASFNPLQIVDREGRTASITVTLVGGIRVQ